MMKRTTIIKLSCMSLIAFTVSMLGGCGTKTTNTSSDTEVKDVINWYMPKSIDRLEDQEMVEKKANEVISKALGVKLHLNFIDSSSYDTKMNMMLAASEELDICFTSSWTNNFLRNAQRGSFMDLTNLIEKYGPDIKAKSDPRAWKPVTVKGQMLAIPAQMPYTTESSLVFKKEFVDKYNFDYKNVKELKDLIPYMETIKKNEQGITPILGFLPEKVNNINTDDTIKGLLFNENTGEYNIALEVPALLNQYRTMYEFYKKGYIANDAVTKSDYMSEAKSGKYAIMLNTGAYTEDGSKSSAAYGFPCVETSMGLSTITTGKMLGALNAISKTSKKPEKAMQVLNLIWKDPQLSNTLAYGVEGVNYVVNTNSAAKRKSVTTKTGKEQTWAIWHNFLGPLWDQWDSSWNSEAALQRMQATNQSAAESSILGFIFDAEPVKAELAQVTSVYSGIRKVLETGCMPDFDQYIEASKQKLKDAGIDKIKAEAQKQLQEWKANKK